MLAAGNDYSLELALLADIVDPEERDDRGEGRGVARVERLAGRRRDLIRGGSVATYKEGDAGNLENPSR